MDFVENYTKFERLGKLSKSECLELAYEEAFRKSDLVIKDEVSRRLRLQILLLEDENDDLHEQLAITDDRVDSLELEREEQQVRIEHTEAESRRHDSELRLRTRELNTVKAELNSMNGLSVDSAKVLTEKLYLARELATLKPELDHLRNQASSQQMLLAEKLALQRQVNTLEVELETEKRAAKRASNKEKDMERDFQLQKDLDILQKQLAKEKREREKAKSVADNGSYEWEMRNKTLEIKIEQLKVKLRETRDQLKEMRAELAQTKVATANASVAEAARVKNSRKRNVQQISIDATIGTPDGVTVRGRRPGVCRGKPEHTLLGEKSTFSITPYLNRTMSVAPDTSLEEAKSLDGEDKSSPIRFGDVIGATAEHEPAARDGASGLRKDASRGQPQKEKANQKPIIRNILNDSKIGKSNSNAGPTKSRLIATLEKVTEEDIDENVDPVVPMQFRMDVKKPVLKTHVTIVEETEPKRKKRKLLGSAKTLFDEEDGEATKRPAKVMGWPASFSRKGGSDEAKSNFRVFGAFSPLKKDKRAT